MMPHRKKCPHVVHFKVPRDWFETTCGIKNVTLKAAKKKVGVAVYWEEKYNNNNNNNLYLPSNITNTFKYNYKYLTL